MKSNEEVSDSIRPLLKLCREQIDRSIRLDATLLKTLERDPLLSGRLERLRTIPGVGPLTALTWVLEIGDVSRFRSIKQAISYCGLCGEEKSSDDKVLRTPISKQRNKHIQRMLVEAARLARRATAWSWPCCTTANGREAMQTEPRWLWLAKWWHT
jgi:transposase